MDGALRWLYRRLGSFYFALFPVVATVEAAAFTFGVVYIGVFRYLALPRSAFNHVFLIAVIGVEIGTVIGTGAILYRSQAAVRWMMGDRRPEHAAAAWRDASRLPTLHWPLAAPPIALSAVPALVAMNDLARPA